MPAARYRQKRDSVVLNAGDRLCGWIESHFEEFRPGRDTGLNSLSQVKAFGELSMVLWALAAPRHRATGQGRYVEWAQDVGTRLWPDLDTIGEQLPWDR